MSPGIPNGPNPAQIDEDDMASLQDDHDAVVERFQPTSGRFTGWTTIVLAVLVVVAGVAYADEGFPPWVAALGLLVGILAWAAMIRPALWATHEHLVMRNLAETVHIRLAAVEGRTWRKALTSRHRPGGLADDAALAPTEGMHYADFVENRLYELVEKARSGAGIRAGSQEQLALPDAVRREPAWLPIGLMVGSALLLVVTLFL